MLGKIRVLIDAYQHEDPFFNRLRFHFPLGSTAYVTIARAYTETMRDFKNVLRDGGSPYFGHPEAVAIIVLEYLRHRVPDTLVASLLHDNLEDLEQHGWTQKRIIQSYGQVPSELVWWVTKPSVHEFGGCEEERDRAYHVRLRSAPREAIMIKLADRLHNLMTLGVHDVVRQRRKVQETRDFYLPLAEAHTILIHELECAIQDIVASWDDSSFVR